MKILFCKIGWMRKYEGYEDDDITGGGSWVDRTHEGGEAYNFIETSDSNVEGFVMHHGQININRLGADKNDDYIDDVLVVWLSKHPVKGGVRVIGWYKNARVFRYFEEANDSSPREEVGYVYNIKSSWENAILLPVEERTLKIPRTKGTAGGYGHSNVWYAEGEKNEAIVNQVLEYIQIYEQKMLKYDCKGVYTFSNEEETFIGEWCDNEKNGYGITQFKDGDKYIGNYQDGENNGNGIYEFQEGDKYIGEFNKDRYNGYGIYIYSNGNKYIGEFRDAMLHGYGMLVYADGDIQCGLWENNELIEEK